MKLVNGEQVVETYNGARTASALVDFAKSHEGLSKTGVVEGGSAAVPAAAPALDDAKRHIEVATAAMPVSLLNIACILSSPTSSNRSVPVCRKGKAVKESRIATVARVGACFL